MDSSAGEWLYGVSLLGLVAVLTPLGLTVNGSRSWIPVAAGFTVHDDGPGFSPDLAPRAFERFTRGDAAQALELSERSIR